ncbi:hypothetical protein FGO68_gene12032 [Halteria grandinella]|uniref:Uncharacterized protein n=1 Tax=Halteria grandinella TaxID=5974 RepID=A0A8J8SWS9_HALGN|nr:hypothetical protein FGO68_gene12032 [Halteria grandinella]
MKDNAHVLRGVRPAQINSKKTPQGARFEQKEISFSLTPQEDDDQYERAILLSLTDQKHDQKLPEISLRQREHDELQLAIEISKFETNQRQEEVEKKLLDDHISNQKQFKNYPALSELQQILDLEDSDSDHEMPQEDSSVEIIENPSKSSAILSKKSDKKCFNHAEAQSSSLHKGYICSQNSSKVRPYWLRSSAEDADHPHQDGPAPKRFKPNPTQSIPSSQQEDMVIIRRPGVSEGQNTSKLGQAQFGKSISNKLPQALDHSSQQKPFTRQQVQFLDPSIITNLRKQYLNQKDHIADRQSGSKERQGASHQSGKFQFGGAGAPSVKGGWR